MKKALTISTSVLVTAGMLMPMSATQAAPANQAAPGHGRYTPTEPTWGTCESPRLQAAGAECGMLEVPLNYARPGGRKIQIAVSRVLHSDPDYKGIIVGNPGGPGGSGLGMARLGAAIPNGVGAKYDWYGFDPRGVGSSTPSLSCDPEYPGAGYDRPNYVPTKPWIMRWWRKTTSQYSRDCARSDARGLLRHMRTTDVAADLDSLRQAVGAKKLNYYGFSYGTYLGQVYATKYPHRVGRFVWDGVLNAKNAFYQANLDQNVQFDKNLDIYFKYLAKHDSAFALGTDWRAIKRGYYRQLRKLDRTPAAGGKLGPDELGDVMLSAGYYVYDWVGLGEAYAKLVNTGDGADLLAMYAEPGDDNGFAVYNAVQCTDAPWPGWKRTRADAWRIHRKHPFLTWGNTWFNAPCLNWPAPSGRAVKVSGAKIKTPILMIGETNDAATVFTGALATRRAFGSSYLIEGVNGTTHSGSLSGVECTDNTIAAYLDTGKLPKRKPGNNRSDQKCDPVPAPEPETALARSFGPASNDRMPADLRQLLTNAQSTGR
ncbi:alpha/beta hydrolase [Nocardioides sp. Bht2]|uniref:alpha/beta hydrolase n=1 Tax=Nocardioides sp. Bht2 TaxID=3392297 RepID=UPI0039B6153B